MNDFSVYVVGLHEKPAAVSTSALEPLSKVKVFGDASKEHFPDESDYLDTEDLTQLVQFCSETIFHTPPHAFQCALKAAEDAQKDLDSALGAFGRKSDIADASDKVLQLARLTKCETVALALIQEHISTPVKLKRILRELKDVEFDDVFSKAHPIVLSAVGTFTGSVTKAAKH